MLTPPPYAHTRSGAGLVSDVATILAQQLGALLAPFVDPHQPWASVRLRSCVLGRLRASSTDVARRQGIDPPNAKGSRPG